MLQRVCQGDGWGTPKAQPHQDLGFVLKAANHAAILCGLLNIPRFWFAGLGWRIVHTHGKTRRSGIEHRF